MSPLVQFNQTFQTFMSTLTRLGENILPVVNTGLMGLAGMMIWLNRGLDWLKQHNAFISGAVSGASTGILGNWSALFGGGGTPVPQGAGRSIVLHHTTNLDGTPLARSVTEYMVKGFGKPPASGNDYDPRMTPVMPGTGGGGY